MFTAMFTADTQLSLWQDSWIHSTPSYSSIPVLVFSYQRTCLPLDLFPSGPPITTIYTFLIRVTLLAHLIIFDFANQNFNEQYKPWIASLPAFSSILPPSPIVSSTSYFQKHLFFYLPMWWNNFNKYLARVRQLINCWNEKPGICCDEIINASIVKVCTKCYL